MKLKNMIEKIELFVFVLSVLFCFKHLIGFIITLTQDDPLPIKLRITEKVVFYFSLSYIITSIILVIT